MIFISLFLLKLFQFGIEIVKKLYVFKRTISWEKPPRAKEKTS